MSRKKEGYTQLNITIADEMMSIIDEESQKLKMKKKDFIAYILGKHLLQSKFKINTKI